MKPIHRLLLFILVLLTSLACSITRITPTPVPATPTSAGMTRPYNPEDLIKRALNNAAGSNVLWLQKGHAIPQSITTYDTWDGLTKKGLIVIDIYATPDIDGYAITFREDGTIGVFKNQTEITGEEAGPIITKAIVELGGVTHVRIIIETDAHGSSLTTRTNYFPNQP